MTVVMRVKRFVSIDIHVGLQVKQSIKKYGDDLEYDASRMANFGRDIARTYAAFLRTQDKLCTEINTAIDSGITPTKIAYDVMGRCGTQQEAINLLSVLTASVRVEKIPPSVIEPFEQGIRPRRI